MLKSCLVTENKFNKIRKISTFSLVTKRVKLLSLQTEAFIQRSSVKKVLKNFEKFTGKYLCQSLFFNKVAELRPATSLKRRLWNRCFPVNFVKILRLLFLQNTAGGCFYPISSNPYATIIDILKLDFCDQLGKKKP